MKIKHYLSKAKRKDFEKILGYWNNLKHMYIIANGNEYNINCCNEMILLIIEYITDCGFKVTFNGENGYTITK